MNIIYHDLAELGFDLKYDSGISGTYDKQRYGTEGYILVDIKTQKPIRSLNSDMKEIVEKMGIKYNEFRGDLYFISMWDIKQRWGLGHKGEF